MRAAVCRAYGPPSSLRLEEVDDPRPGPGEVLVDVHAAGVNFTDLLILQNRYQLSAPLPFIPGSEISGVVRETGTDVTGVRPGDAVTAQMLTGAFAERVVVPADRLAPVPEDLGHRDAAAFWVAYGTAYHALRSGAALLAGETLLVLGAAGGVGLAAVRIGALLGARVIAAASSPERLRVCREQGASETIDSRAENLKDRLKVLTGGRGVDVVLDPVGGANAELAVRATGWRGRYLSVGFASGEVPRIPVNLLLLKGCEVRAFNVALLATHEPEEMARNERELRAFARDRGLRPHVSAVFPLDEAVRALEHLASRRAVGKIVIEIRPAGASG